MSWMTIKTTISDLTVEMDALHIYAALVIQLAVAWLSRRPLGNWLPWCAVLSAELANEYLDTFWGETSSPQRWQEAGALHDIVNTMILPTTLLLLVRYAPSLFRSAGRVGDGSPVHDPTGSSRI
jgi:hypothetical protein